jgi:hypothetical protein
VVLAYKEIVSHVLCIQQNTDLFVSANNNSFKLKSSANWYFVFKHHSRASTRSITRNVGHVNAVETANTSPRHFVSGTCRYDLVRFRMSPVAVLLSVEHIAQ